MGKITLPGLTFSTGTKVLSRLLLLGSGVAGRAEDDAIASLGFGGIQGAVSDGEQGFNASVSIGWVVDGGSHAAVECELGFVRTDLQV